MNHEVKGAKVGDVFSATIDSAPRLGLRDHLVKVFARGRELDCHTIEIFAGTEALADSIRHIAGMEFHSVVHDPLSPDRRRYFVLRKTIGVPRVERMPTAIDYAGRTPLPQQTYPDWDV